MKFFVHSSAKSPYGFIIKDDGEGLSKFDWREISNAELIVEVKRHKARIYALNNGRYPWKILSNADVLYWAVSRGIPIMKKVGWKWRRTKL